MPSYCIADRISEHMARTPENFLLCKDVPIARTATRVPQKYRGSEIHPDLPADLTFDVWRSAEEVFSKRAMASAEGKPVVSPHPPVFLDPLNAGWYSKGHLQNVRVGPELDDGERSLIADLLITDATLIEQVENGTVRSVSLGYKCQYWAHDDESFEQREILVNHAALVESGRAGREIAIMDSDSEASMNKEVRDKLNNVLQLCEDAVRASKLREEARSIERDGQLTQKLTRENVGPGAMHRALMENSAYREREAGAQAGQDFADAAKRAGLELQRKHLPASMRCTDSAAPIREHADPSTDYADMVNAVGRRLRGR